MLNLVQTKQKLNLRKLNERFFYEFILSNRVRLFIIQLASLTSLFKAVGDNGLLGGESVTHSVCPGSFKAN